MRSITGVRGILGVLGLLGALATFSAGCSDNPKPTPRAAPSTEVTIREKPRAVTPLAEPLHVHLTSVRGSDLYIPSHFAPDEGGYDLLVHFHGMKKLQEQNVEQAQLNAAVVSVNLGMGTDSYGKPFARKEAFASLLEEAEREIAQSGRAKGARLRRLALSAWSAGYVSVAKVMNDPAVAAKVDAVLLADGFFTSFTNVKKRTVNEDGIAPFARFAESASRGEKLFAITHTTIPTGEYPSVQECVTKLLEIASFAKKPSPAVGPGDMKQIYVVDRGDFHVRGYEGRTAHDHVQQIRAMSETLYPYLRARWAGAAAPAAAPATRGAEAE